MKINVAQLGSPAGLYGAERWILALVRHLDPQKIKSWVCALKDDPALMVPLCSEAAKLGIQTKVFSAYGRVNFKAIAQVRRFLHVQNIDILHTHGYKQDLIGLLATMGTTCCLVSTPHGWSQDAGFKLGAYEMLNRLVFPFFDAVVPLSRELYDNLLPIPFLKPRLKFIQNSVDTSEIVKTRTMSRELADLKQGKVFVIGYMGQLILRKGLDVLLKAAAMLDSSLNCRVAIVGEGEHRCQLEALASDLKIKEKVHFFGFRENRLSFLRGFDVFVLPSRLEGIPRCLMESMAAGIPVIASNIPGCRDLIQEGLTGRLFRMDDPQDLCKQLFALYNDRDNSRKMAGRAQETIFKTYAAKGMAQKYERLYDGLKNG